jgi:hypothetical protein
MMQQMAASADNHAQTPARGGQADNPCKPALVCQAAAAAVAPPSEGPASIVLTAALVEHGPADALAAPSRPPDRNLRPPIQL